MGRPLEERRAAYADPEWRAQAVQGFTVQERLRPRWDTYELVGQRRSPGPRRPPRGRGGRRAGFGASRPHPRCSPSRPTTSTSGSTASCPTTTPTRWPACCRRTTAPSVSPTPAPTSTSSVTLPRPPSFLGAWVRDRSLMPIEEAVRKLTGVQADLFGFADRGYLRPGGVGRRDGVRSGHGRIRPGPPGPRLPRRRRTADRGSADRGSPTSWSTASRSARTARWSATSAGRRPGQVVGPTRRS